MVARLGQVQDGQRLRGLSRGHGQRSGDPDGGLSATFQRGEPGLQHHLGGIHDPGVDVAHLGQPEQGGSVLGVAEHIGGGLVDGHSPRSGGRIGLLPRVDLLGLETPVFAHGSSLFLPELPDRY